MAGKNCTRCGKLWPLNRYGQIKKKGEPSIRKPVCLACEALETSSTTSEKIEERALSKEVSKKKKAVRKKATLDRIAVKKYNKKVRARKEKAKAIAAEIHIEDIQKRKELLKVQGAEREIAQRALCRRKLLPFIQKFNKTYSAGWVHQDICGRLERFVAAVARGESPRLMLFMPPRHGKSEIASKNLPAWVLGQYPDWEIIAASYAVSLPIGFSRKVQSLIQDPYYHILFPKTKLHPKAQSAEAWMTTAEGGYVAAGVGGGITGKGAHIFIIDDPVKDAQEADSDTQRSSVWDWWGSTAKTRLAPGGGVLVIQTRWHDDDLSGRLLEQMKELKKEFGELIEGAEKRLEEAAPGSTEYHDIETELHNFRSELTEIDDWEVVTYPAINEQNDEYITSEHKIITEDDHRPGTRLLRAKGTALHEHRYPLSRLRNMKRSMQPRHWSALYQQNPVPDEGIYFTKDMIRFTNAIPPLEELYIFSAWDLAVGEKQSNDYIVGAVGGLDWQGQIHVLDIIRFRQADNQIVAETILNTCKRFPNMMQTGVEKGQLELALWPTLKKEMDKRQQYPTFNHELKPITDKWIRARPLQGRMQQGTVLFPYNQPWVETAQQELLRFPGGLHDDIVDALAWMVRMIQHHKEPPKPGAKKGSRKDTLDYKLKQILREGSLRTHPMGA